MEKAVRMEVKPLSVNDAWKGRRYKTPEYKSYEKLLLFTLPKKIDLPDPPFTIYFEFGINTLGDWDNPIKPLQDILQKKYGFNDRDVLLGIIRKVIVPIGKEYFTFKIVGWEQTH